MKNELPRVGLEPTTLQCSTSSATKAAQLIVHLINTNYMYVYISTQCMYKYTSYVHVLFMYTDIDITSMYMYTCTNVSITSLEIM